MATAAEILTNVEAAIQARFTGGAVQSYSIGSRNIQYISLRELREMRKDLLKEVASTRTAKQTRTYAKFERP